MRVSDITYRNAEGNTRFVYPIEKYNEQLKKSPGNKSTDDATAIKSQIDNVFTSLYNALNSYQTIHIPSDQDLQWCNLLTKTIDYSNMQTTYDSPGLDNVQVSKSIIPGSSTLSLYFYFHRREPIVDDVTIYITFQDGTTTSFVAPNGGSLIGADGHLCGLKLNESNISNFKDKKIAMFRVGDRDFTVDDALSNKVQAWVNCMPNLY